MDNQVGKPVTARKRCILLFSTKYLCMMKEIPTSTTVGKLHQQQSVKLRTRSTDLPVDLFMQYVSEQLDHCLSSCKKIFLVYVRLRAEVLCILSCLYVVIMYPIHQVVCAHERVLENNDKVFLTRFHHYTWSKKEHSIHESQGG